MSVLAHQLDKNLQGRLTWTAGLHSSMNATLVWDREQHHVVTSIQVCIRFLLTARVGQMGVIVENENNLSPEVYCYCSDRCHRPDTIYTFNDN